MSETPRTVEQRLDEWMKQPGAIVTRPEREFINYMRVARAQDVGFGWMQQVIEWEWQATGSLALGPEYFSQRIAALESALALAQKALRQPGMRDGPCYYCGEPTQSLAGNPGLWPIGLCHADDPGRVKPHHEGCVMDRLRERDAARACLRDVRDEVAWYIEHNKVTVAMSHRVLALIDAELKEEK